MTDPEPHRSFLAFAEGSFRQYTRGGMPGCAWWAFDGSTRSPQPVTATVVRPSTLTESPADRGSTWQYWRHVAELATYLVASRHVAPLLDEAGFSWTPVVVSREAVQVRSRLLRSMPAEARALVRREAVRLPRAEDVLDGALAVLVRTLLADVTPIGVSSPLDSDIAAVHEWVEEVRRELEQRRDAVLTVRPSTREDGRAGDVWLLGAGLRQPDGTLSTASVLWDRPAEHEDERRLLLHRLNGVRAVEPVDALLRLPVPEAMEIDAHDFETLLDASAQLADAGVHLDWSEAVRGVIDPVKAIASTPGATGGPGGQRFTETWDLRLDGQALTDVERASLTGEVRRLVRMREQWVVVPEGIDRALRRRSREVSAAEAALSLASGPAGPGEGAMGGAVVTAVDDAARRAGEELRLPPSAIPFAPPPALRAELRRYQRDGAAWLSRANRLGLGVCLADDMGLGKTLQTITAYLRLAEDLQGPDWPAALVACPSSLLDNWRTEFEKFAPDVPVTTYHGSARELPAEVSGVVITTHGVVRHDERLAQVGAWSLVVLDEAQHAKNPRTQLARALRRLPAARRVALTGTPVENSLMDLWAVLNWTNPTMFHSAKAFRRQWADPIEKGDLAAARQLKAVLRPLLLRRAKSDPSVAPELPAKIYTDHYVELTPPQRALYAHVVGDLLEAAAGSQGIDRHASVLSLITAAKQICDHPALWAGDSPRRLAEHSEKVQLLDELLETVEASGGAALVFTQYVTMGRLLEQHYAAQGRETLFLHGSLSPSERTDLVERFQDESRPAPIFLLSLRAAGSGLNLTRADHVVHFDHWWNPAVEDQASDRAHRIGQCRTVQVHRLLTRGTVEERVQALLGAKRRTAAAVTDVGADELSIAEQGDEQLRALFELGRS